MGDWQGGGSTNRFAARQLHMIIAADVLDYAEALCA